MRPRVLTMLAVAAAAVGTGCQESGFDESRETARPLKVQHALGDIGGTKVPGQAERPATLTLDALDDTLALGVEPVWASVPGGRIPAHLRHAAAGVKPAGPITVGDLAALESSDPDVILASQEAQERLYPDLSAIAPTIVTDAGGAGWQLNLRLHGEALGRTNDAERLLVDWDRRVAAVRDVVGAAGSVVSVVLVTADGMFMAGADSFAGRVLSDVGLERPAPQRGPFERKAVARIETASLAGDLLLLSVASGAEHDARRLEASPAWRKLTAPRSGKAVRVDHAVWWSGGGILAARAALRDLEDALRQ